MQLGIMWPTRCTLVQLKMTSQDRRMAHGFGDLVMTDERLQRRQREREQTKAPRQGVSRSGGGDVPRTPSGPSGSDDGRGRHPFNGWKSLAAVATVAAVAVAGFMAFSSGPAVDSVTEAEAQSRATAYSALLASPGLALELVATSDIEKAISSVPDSVTEEQREELRADVNEGRIKLAWITLWDTHAEDGDILRLESSSSFPIEVMALHTKTTIAIPYPADGNVVVTGVKDGGGGITIAVESGAARIDWPTMAPGDTLNLPVMQGF